ncbi:MAG: dihydropteroate synthase [Porticoccaceae bacterium]|jgi:dihydropteroate synthase|nr:dihydropteroate synthase [Porticoccaceae bacterium]MBT5577067.1 dihydropteroate synthase [Porticoccaceae bacterium]MBT7374512.1 dihydropteroate synthase [Porticoccaceae bacterium]
MTQLKSSVRNLIPQLKCGSKLLDLSRPAVMGILNITPDSFSDGGQLYSGDQLDQSKTLFAVEAMLAEGADIIDIGGESTRPGAQPVSEEQELQRVMPILEAVANRFDTIISVDTSTAKVMSAAAAAGAHIINDVRALSREGAMQAAADSGLPVCLMHMQNQPDSMQHNPQYDDVVSEVKKFLEQRKKDCMAAGIMADQLILDPGFGFGKTLAHNMALFNGLEQMAVGSPVLVGVSRKTMIGQLFDADVNNRLLGSVTMALLAAQKIAAAQGSLILRVHDVKETVQTLRVWQQCRKGN